MKQNRILVFVFAAIVLTTAIVVVVINTTTQKAYDVNSPEGTVQNYLESIYAGDTAKASGYISSSSFCTVEDLDQMGIQTKPRILFADSSITGNMAQVKINVEIDNGSPMGNVTNESHTLRLVRFGTGWQLTGIPWPLYDCGVIKK
jgi:hypothetical protein